LRQFRSFIFSRKAGYSLVELLVVVAVIMIVASISAPIGTVVFYREKEILLRKNLSKIRKAIDDYYEYTKGQYRLLEAEMTDAEFLPDDPDNPAGTRYTSDEYWDWKFYPTSWQELYLNNFLKPEDTVNPFTGVPEDFDIVMAVPLEYIQQRRLKKQYGVEKDQNFNLPKYPDGVETAVSPNFDMKDRAPGLGLSAPGLIKYALAPAVPEVKDKNGNTVIKYVFSKKEWYTYFVDPQTGSSQTFSASEPDPRIQGSPITYPYKVNDSNSTQIPFYSPRIFDVRYPEHHVSLDGYTYYDQW
jgi:prepilin-type N-terminal cleavage/methylation domain-containing protein